MHSRIGTHGFDMHLIFSSLLHASNCGDLYFSVNVLGPASAYMHNLDDTFPCCACQQIDCASSCSLNTIPSRNPEAGIHWETGNYTSSTTHLAAKTWTIHGLCYSLRIGQNRVHCKSNRTSQRQGAVVQLHCETGDIVTGINRSQWEAQANTLLRNLDQCKVTVQAPAAEGLASTHA